MLLDVNRVLLGAEAGSAEPGRYGQRLFRATLPRMLIAVGAVVSGFALTAAPADAACPMKSNPEANYSCPVGPNYVIPALPDNMGWDRPSHYDNIVYGDVNGDGAEEMVARGEAGTEVFRFKASLGQWSQMAVAPILPDRAGWSAPDRYHTLMLGDIDGDGRAELLVRSASGVIVYRFGAGPTADGGHWAQLTHSGPFAGAIWDRPEYYSTIKLLPIAASGAKATMQLVGRGPQGLEVYRWNGSDRWDALPALTAVSDQAGFGAPAFRGSITAWDSHLLFAQGPRGVQVFRYSPQAFNPWSVETTSGPCDETPTAGTFSCIPGTVELAHGVRGAGTDPVVIALDRRGFGLQAARYLVASRRWQELRSGDPRHDPWSGAHAPLTDTVQTADLGGDGVAEILGRAAGGIAVFRPQVSAGGTFALQRLSVHSPELIGGRWDDPSSYRTITTAKLLPHFQGRFLLARGELGVRTWRWDASRSAFVRPLPYGSFPTVDTPALRAMTTYLGIAHGTVRDAYAVRTADPSSDQLSGYETRIEKTCSAPETASPPRFGSCAPPAGALASGVSPAAWTATANQILTELSWARSVVDYFSQLNRIQSELFLDQRAQFPALEADLKVAASQTLVTRFNTNGLVNTVIGIVAGLPIPFVSPVAGVIGSALSLVAAGTPVGEGKEPSEIDVNFSELHGRITRLQHEMRDAITDQRRQALADYGLLGSIGGMVGALVWRPDGQAALSAGREGFTRTIYHSVLPSLWDRWTVTACGREGFVCHRPSPSALVRETKVEHAWNFDGILPKQKPCEPIFLTVLGNCTFKSLEESHFTATEHILIDPISAQCMYDPNPGTSWRYGCSLGVPPSALLEPESPHSYWKFRVRRCQWNIHNGDFFRGRETCQTAQD